jgi:hypothetical protein
MKKHFDSVRQEKLTRANTSKTFARNLQRWARTTFFESAIAIPQLEGSTSAIAILQLLKKCYSATATPQFRNRNFFGVRNFKSAT